MAAKKDLESCQAADNVDQLEKTVNSLRVDLEKMKHERFDLENRLKMSEKRVEVSCQSENNNSSCLGWADFNVRAETTM